MIFNISPMNAEKIKESFVPSHVKMEQDLKKSALLTAKNEQIIYNYEIDVIDSRFIICVVRQEYDVIAIIRLCNYTENSIEIKSSQLYKHYSDYPYRTEYSDRFLKKYDQIACIVHGAISAGMLFPAETHEERAETPKESTAPAKDANNLYKYGMRVRGYSIGAQPAGVVCREDDPTGQYYDIIAYCRELTQEEIEHYSLTPLQHKDSEAHTETPDDTEQTTERPRKATKQPQGRTERFQVYKYPLTEKNRFTGQISGSVSIPDPGFPKIRYPTNFV